MEERQSAEERTGQDSTHEPPSVTLLVVARRGPFTLNSMVLLPLLRSLPLSSGVSLAAAFASTTGLDFGMLRLGRPDTAADALVASMMAFSVAVPVLWAVYMASNGVKWLTAAAGDLRNWTRAKPNVASDPTAEATARQSRPEASTARPTETIMAAPASLASLQNAPTVAPPE